MINTKYKYSELTSKIIGAAMEVHSYLGNGFQEVIYQRALSYELELRKIDHAREVEMDVMYKECLVGCRRVDFLIGEKISVEIKSSYSIRTSSPCPSNQLFRGLQLRSRLTYQFRRD